MAKKKAVKKRKKVKKKTVKKKKKTAKKKTRRKTRKVTIVKPKRKPIKVRQTKIKVITVGYRKKDEKIFKIKKTSHKQSLLKIQRYHPEKDIQPHFVEYSYKIKNNDTLFDAFNHIKWNEDESFVFRGGCRMGLCGACAVRVNGHAFLACSVTLHSLLEQFNTNVLTIEPLKNFKVVKDLVVDMEPYWREMKKVKAWLIPDEKKELKPAQLEKIQHAGDCINCGVCMSDCSVVREDTTFIGPSALLKSYRFVYDSRDAKRLDRLYYANQFGLWKCTEMFNCVEQCPKKIDIYQAIVALREEVIKEGFTCPGIRYTKSFVNSVRQTGKLDETRLFLVSNPIGAVKSIRTALKMYKHDKQPSFFPLKIKSYKKFKEIYDHAEE